ncbi:MULTISPECIES: hypothetical protein, partial [unclassified Burkholderia]|uniref:hypothetical protein n=1 Tax=unclassified Burkholderia TaxID=2613784 RepID=UPI001ABB623B
MIPFKSTGFFFHFNYPESIRETLINRRSREVVGDVGGEWPDTEAKRRPFGEVCPEDAPYFS